MGADGKRFEKKKETDEEKDMKPYPRPFTTLPVKPRLVFWRFVFKKKRQDKSWTEREP